jgi:uncharacterized membrane protein YkoI
MQRTPWIGAAVLLAACLAAAPAVSAEAVTAGRELTPSQATALVQQRYGARVVRASSTSEDGRRVYVFRLLSPAGKVWEVRIDARSGTEVH